MKIVDMNNDKINAAFVFNIGNCEIIISTIFNKDNPEIAIFDRYSDELLKDKVNTIPEAIHWVHTFGPRD